MFKKIPGFSNYTINEQGVIRCKIGNKVIPTHRSNGYVFVHIVSDEGQPQSVGVHRCLALAFIECPGDPKRLVVNHKDNCKWNNALSNLEWVTRSRNQSHAVEEGTGAAIPTKVVNLKTNEEKRFPSIKEAREYRGISIDTFYTSKDKVFGDYKIIPLYDELGYERFAVKLRGLMIRDIYKNKVTIVANLADAERLTGVETKVIKRILKGQRFTFPVNGFDIRALDSSVVWPEYSDEELEAYRGLFFIHNPVRIEYPDGSTKLFGSVLRAAVSAGLHERSIRGYLKTGGRCRNGFRYTKHKNQ